MSKAELVEEIANQTGLTKKTSKKAFVKDTTIKERHTISVAGLMATRKFTPSITICFKRKKYALRIFLTLLKRR